MSKFERTLRNNCSILHFPGTPQLLHHHDRRHLHRGHDPPDPPPQGQLERQDARVRGMGRIRGRPDAPLVHRDGRRRKYHGQGESETNSENENNLLCNRRRDLLVYRFYGASFDDPEEKFDR